VLHDLAGLNVLKSILRISYGQNVRIKLKKSKI
jgi:hypothetical protein